MPVLRFSRHLIDVKEEYIPIVCVCLSCAALSRMSCALATRMFHSTAEILPLRLRCLRRL